MESGVGVTGDLWNPFKSMTVFILSFVLQSFSLENSLCDRIGGFRGPFIQNAFLDKWRLAPCGRSSLLFLKAHSLTQEAFHDQLLLGFCCKNNPSRSYIESH